MKRTAWKFPAGSSRKAGLESRGLALSLVLLVAAAAHAVASTRPKTGGTLRVHIGERVDNLDPRRWPAAPSEQAAAERLSSLVFDRLVRLDEHGMPQPALAISWQHDAQAKRWQFRLRDGVKFSDGTPLTPPIAAMALQQLLGLSFDVSALADSVVIVANQSSADLPIQLAMGRYFIFRQGDDGSLTGTGPFVFTLFESFGRAAQAVFVANENCWVGRPFVDKIAISMNVDPEQQTNAIAFGQADVVELRAPDVRRAALRGVRTVSSEPVELFALTLDATGPAMQNVRLRQAISLAVDRVSIADVVLQKQGVAAGSLLPNWISGYAHLFPPAFDLGRAKDLLGGAGHELSPSGPLALVYDSNDAEMRPIADRVAVNLREAGIMVQVLSSFTAKTEGRKPAAADLRLVRARIDSPDPAEALSEILRALGETAGPMETLQQVYDAERAPIEAYRVIPLVHVTESYGLSPQVRDWMAPRWGGWDLADVWLGPPATSDGAGAPNGPGVASGDPTAGGGVR